MARGLDEAEHGDLQLQAIVNDPDKESIRMGDGEGESNHGSSVRSGSGGGFSGSAAPPATRNWADFCNDDDLDAGNAEDHLAQVIR